MTADPEFLLKKVLFASAAGGGLFLATFVQVVCRRHSRDSSEIPYIRELILCERLITGIFIALLIPLWWMTAAGLGPVAAPITSYGNGNSWNFGWGRPSMHFTLSFVGFFLDYHPAARYSCVVGMAQAVIFDTLSSYDLGTQLECVESGRCALQEQYTVFGLRLLIYRDLVSVLLATWGLLLIGYLSLVIGTCRTKYSFRQLHVGDHNRVEAMRAELAKHGRRQAELEIASTHSGDDR